MSTNNIEKVLLIYGYIRENIEKEMAIPDAIKELCVLFVSLWFDIKFEWSPDRGWYEDDTIIDKTAVRYIKGSDYRIVLSKNLISSKKYLKYEWEITLTNWTRHFGLLHNIYIGFVDIPIEKSVCRFNNGLKEDPNTKNNQHGILISYIHGVTSIKLVKDTGIGRHRFQSVSQSKIKQGDRFKICFDFDTREGILYHNDEKICVVFKDIPNEFIPTVSLYKSDINCSRFRGCV